MIIKNFRKLINLDLSFTNTFLYINNTNFKNLII